MPVSLRSAALLAALALLVPASVPGQGLDRHACPGPQAYALGDQIHEMTPRGAHRRGHGAGRIPDAVGPRTRAASHPDSHGSGAVHLRAQELGSRPERAAVGRDRLRESGGRWTQIALQPGPELRVTRRRDRAAEPWPG
jgi:hypothetical protein